MARNIQSYELQGRRAFYGKVTVENPYKKKDIREAWQRGYDSAKADHARQIEKEKVVRWKGGGWSSREGIHTEFYLRGEAPQIAVYRDAYLSSWHVSCHAWGISGEALKATDVDQALEEAPQKILDVMQTRAAEIEKVVKLPKIEGP